MKKLAFRAGEKTLRERLYRELREALRRGRYGAGDKFHSDRALMRSQQASLITVRAALGRLVAEGLIERRRGSGTYVTNLMPAILGLRAAPPHERHLAPRKVTPNRLRIGLISHRRGWTSSFVAVYREICERAAQEGHTVHMLPRWDESGPLDAWLDSLELSFLDAVIWAMPRVGAIAALQRIKRRGLPLVVINSHFFEEPMHEVTTDHAQGLYLATSHLLRAGHERIALVIGLSARRTVAQGERGYELTFQDCKQGYTRALWSEGILARDELVIEQEYGRAPNRVLSFLERSRPTAAIFSTSVLLEKFLQRDGLARFPVPDKLSVISADNRLSALRARWPATEGWTWLHDPLDVLGRMAFEKAVRLCRQSEPPTRTLVPMTLVQGGSVAKR